MRSRSPSHVSSAAFINRCRAQSVDKEQVAQLSRRNLDTEQLLAAGGTSTALLAGAELCTNLNNVLLDVCEGNHDELPLLWSTAARHFGGVLPTNPTERAHTLALIRALASIEAVRLQMRQMCLEIMPSVLSQQQHLTTGRPLDPAAGAGAAECTTHHSNTCTLTSNYDKLQELMRTATRHLEAIPSTDPTGRAHTLASARANVAALQLQKQHTIMKAGMSFLLRRQQESQADRSPGPAATPLETSAPRQVTTSRPSTALKPAATPQPQQQPAQSQRPVARASMQRVQTSTTYTPLRIEPCAPVATAEAPTVPVGPRAAHRHLAAALVRGLTPEGLPNTAQSVRQPQTTGRYIGKHQPSEEPHLADLCLEGLQLSAGFSTTSQSSFHEDSAASISGQPLGTTRSDPPNDSHAPWASPGRSQVTSTHVRTTVTTSQSQSGLHREVPVRHLIQRPLSDPPTSPSIRTRPAPGTTVVTHWAGGSRRHETGPAVSMHAQQPVAEPEAGVQGSECQLLSGWRPDDDTNMDHMVAWRSTREDAAGGATTASARRAALEYIVNRTRALHAQVDALMSQTARSAVGTTTFTQQAGGSRRQEHGPAVSMQTQQAGVQESERQLPPGGWSGNDDHMEHMSARRSAREDVAGGDAAGSRSTSLAALRHAVNGQLTLTREISARLAEAHALLFPEVATARLSYMTDSDPARSTLHGDVRADMADVTSGGAARHGKQGFCGLHHDSEWVSQTLKAAQRGHRFHTASGRDVRSYTSAPLNS